MDLSCTVKPGAAANPLLDHLEHLSSRQQIAQSLWHVEGPLLVADTGVSNKAILASKPSGVPLCARPQAFLNI